MSPADEGVSGRKTPLGQMEVQLSKSLTRTLYLIAIIGFIVGIVVGTIGASQTTVDATTGAASLTGTGAILALVGVALYVIAGILAFVAWIGALIKTAQLQRWGWFVCLIVFSGITMLIYIFAGPETRPTPAAA